MTTIQISAPFPHRQTAALRTPGRVAWGPPPTFVTVLFACDLLVGLLAVLGFAVGEPMLGEKIDLFRLGEESNLPTWFSASQLLLVGLTLGALAWGEWRRDDRATWLLALPAALFVALSFDEVAMVHERVGDLARTVGAANGLGVDGTVLERTGPWMVLCVPLFLAAVAGCAWATRRWWATRPAVVAKFAAGFALLVGAGAGLEFLGNLVAAGGTAQKVLVLFEEVGEMVAGTVLLWAAVDLLASHGYRLGRVERGEWGERV